VKKENQFLSFRDAPKQINREAKQQVIIYCPTNYMAPAIRRSKSAAVLPMNKHNSHMRSPRDPPKQISREATLSN